MGFRHASWPTKVEIWLNRRKIILAVRANRRRWDDLSAVRLKDAEASLDPATRARLRSIWETHRLVLAPVGLLALKRELKKRLELMHMLDAVPDEMIEFATTRDYKSPLPFGRRVVVTGPPDLVRMAALGEPRILGILVRYLKDPDRQWSAEVVLASLTHRDEDLVAIYATERDKWKKLLGLGAYASWSAWWKQNEGRLVWDPVDKSFSATDFNDQRQ